MIAKLSLFFTFLVFSFISWGNTGIYKEAQPTYSGWGAILENKGQMKDLNGRAIPFVLFKTSAKGLDAYITDKGLTYVFIDWLEEAGEEKNVYNHKEEGKQFSYERVDVELVGANIKSKNIIKEFPGQERIDIIYLTKRKKYLALKIIKKLPYKKSIRE